MSDTTAFNPDGPDSSTATIEVDQHSREELMKLADDLTRAEPLRLPRRVEVEEAFTGAGGPRRGAPSPATESVDEAVREQLLQFAEEVGRTLEE